ncbi:MAG TPA: ferredoxin [Phycisphaerae bacterium]|nr:ferredoxin [Phycisphaerae bacterium]
MAEQDNNLSRRDLLKAGLRTAAAAGIGAAAVYLLRRGRTAEASQKDTVWQIDPYKCIHCGNCATKCVLEPSAVKCVHAYSGCGYCNICAGFLRPRAPASAPPYQQCPVNAIERFKVEDGAYGYRIIEDLCIGCGKCCEGCHKDGNGSLFLQVRHDLCLNCNSCAIAAACPSGAFVKVSADNPYLLKWKDIKG